MNIAWTEKMCVALDQAPEGFSLAESYKNSFLFKLGDVGFQVKLFDDTATVFSKVFYNKDRMSRDASEGPAYQRFYGDGSILKECYYMNGSCHRDGLPAKISYSAGKKVKETYYRLGLVDRQDGPAHLEWHPNGQLSLALYVANDALWRADGPAVEKWDEAGNKISEVFVDRSLPRTRRNELYQEYLWRAQLY